MNTASSTARKAALIPLLLAAAACGHLNLPPPEGIPLAERRRALVEDPAAGVTVIPKAGAEETAAPAAITEANEAVGATAAPEQGAAPEPSATEAPKSAASSMSEAKKLESPELGIRLPIGDPTLKPRQRGTAE